jgi:hypothetical protein
MGTFHSDMDVWGVSLGSHCIFPYDESWMGLLQLSHWVSLGEDELCE